MSIQTGIELHDGFSNVINGILNAVNMTVSAMEDMQSTMSADVDTGSIQGIRDELTQATIAANELDAALQSMNIINTDSMPVVPNAPGGNPMLDRPQIQPNGPPELEVFTDTGVDRFRQEVQSANIMLEQLCSTQNDIARQAYNTDIISPEAFQNLNRLSVRMDMVRDRIQQIENNPMNMGTDTANAELEHLRSQLNSMIGQQNRLNVAMQNMDVGEINASYLQLSQTVGNTERYIRDNVDEQGRFNQEIQEGTSNANGLMNAIRSAVSIYALLRGVGAVINLSDELTQTTSRLNLMNDGVQTTNELVNMVYASAQNARGSFTDMAAVVARFGNNAKDAFESSAEVVAFGELIQKQFTIAGAGTQEANAALLQLSQGMGSGVLRGQELNAVFEQAPNIIQTIADYMDVPIGQIREMAADGQITADVIKAAMFSASNEINEKFESMPMTWGQIWQSMQNTAIMAFRPVLQRLNDLANSDGLQNFVNGAIEAMATVANIVIWIFDLVASVGGFVADNWSIISPIIWGVIAALAVYGAYLAITKGMELASAAAHAVLTGARFLGTAALVLFTGATWAAAAAQTGLNGTMYACPIVWIIILIIAIIALLIALCNWIAEVTGVADSGIGIIVGALSTALAFIVNLLLGLLDLVLGVISNLYNHWAMFANFFGNVFRDPIGSIIHLFGDMADNVLAIIETIASALDKVFGSNLAGAVQGWRSGLNSWIEDAANLHGNGEYEKVVEEIQLTSEDLGLRRWAYTDAWNSGVELGDGIASAIDNFSLSDIFGKTDIPDPSEYTTAMDEMGSSLDEISQNTGDTADSVDITEEDLKYLRDIAEQESVNRFTTAEIKIEQTNHNTISSGMDLDGVVSGLTDAVNEAVDSIAEGVHE